MKKKIATNFFWSLTLFVSLLISTTGAWADAPQTWKIGHVRASGSAVDKAIHSLVENIIAHTDGAISFNVYPGNRLGDYSVVQERVSFGEVEMYVGPVATAIDKRLMLAFTPFLVDNWKDAQKIYSHGSPMLRQVAQYLEAQHIKLIGGWPVYFGGIALTKKPISPGDPEIDKEMIIRVPPIRSFEMTARSLGFTPYPITWMYAKMGLKTGMVSGIIGGGAEGYAGLGEHVKYYIPVKDHFEYWFVYMNLDLWKALSPKTREIIQSGVIDMEKERYAVGESDEKRSLEQLERQGIEIINLTQKERSKIKERVRSAVWPQLKKEIGPAFDSITGSF